MELATQDSPRKLPVIATAIEAIKSPLIRWREFFRFGWILLALNLLEGLLFLPMRNSANSPEHPQVNVLFGILELLILLATIVVAVPFEVAWIRLTLNGANAVTNRPVWIFGGVERRLLLAKFQFFLIGLMPAAICGVITAVFFHASKVLSSLGLIVSLAVLVLGISVTIRLSFILVELAIQRYRRVGDSWERTRDCFWRLIGIELVSSLAYGIIGAIAGLITFRSHGGMPERAAGDIVTALIGFAATAASWSGLALAYKFTAPEPEATVLASTS